MLGGVGLLGAGKASCQGVGVDAVIFLNKCVL